MLLLINKTNPGLLQRISRLAGDEDPDVLLVGDGVFYGSDFMVEKLRAIGVEEVYASKPCLETRQVKLSDKCVVVGYDEMVPLIMDEHEKTICP